MSHHRGKLILLPPNRVWRTYPGGKTLDQLAHAPSPADSHMAEDWIASTTRAVNPPQALRSSPTPPSPTPPGISQVRVGLDPTPRDFAQLLASDPDYFLGAAHVKKYGAQPQLLVKFLDSGTRLHFQAHPTREFAQRVLGAPSGKTEAYYVLGVRGSSSSPEPTGCIYVGFQRPPTPAQLRDYIVTQDIAAIEACFDRIYVKPGDTFIIPGGTPHALGAGVFMVEIQEPSDLVIRFEFERAGFVLPESARFMNRDVDFALTMFNLAALTPREIDSRIRCHPRRIRDLGPDSFQDELIGARQTDCFRMAQTHVGAPLVKDETSSVIAIVTAGAVMAEAGGESHRLDIYEKLFLPAGLGPVKFTPLSGHAEILECFPRREPGLWSYPFSRMSGVSSLLAVLTPTEVREFLPEPLLTQVRSLTLEYRLIDPTGVSDAEFARELATIDPDVVLGCWKTPTLPELLPPRLRYVCYISGSVKKLISRSHLERGLLVTNWGGSISRTVAEAALFHILACLRNASHWAVTMHQPGVPAWKNGLTDARSLFCRSVGIHGFGSVARELVGLLKPWNCPITALSPDLTAELAHAYGVERAPSLDALFAENEIIVELAPLIPATVGMVNERVLRLIRPGGVFVNVGRGAVVDEAALLRVASEGRINVGLDVYSVEPLPAESGFRAIPHVSLTPHIAGPTIDRYPDAGAFAVKNLRSYVDSRPLEAVVTPEIYDQSS